MSDPGSARYDAIPYRHGVVPNSHPGRLGAIARLLGLDAAPPDRCRVLEIGSAEGMNLLPLAERFPHSEFLGIDYSPVQTAVAEQAGASCGLQNARFVAADIREFEPEEGAYDYVIAHGVYSWVPVEVRDRLLSTARRALTPAGVAYVSYNTLPGSGILSGLREVLLTEIAREQEPQAQMDHVGRVLDSLARCLANQPGGQAAAVREVVAGMQKKPRPLLFHDELEIYNDPCTFSHFVEHAGRHGLHYFGEAQYATTALENVPSTIREEFANLELDPLRTQQFMDVIFPRWLRNSLLCTREIGLDGSRDLRVLRECAIGLKLRLSEARVNLGPGVPMKLVGAGELSMELTGSAEKAFAAGLAQAAPDRVHFQTAIEQANRFLAQVGLPLIEDTTSIEGLAHRLFSIDGLDVILAGDGSWIAPGQPLRPSVLMQYQAKHDLPLSNRWHELIGLTPEGRRALLDPVAASPAALKQASLFV